MPGKRWVIGSNAGHRAETTRLRPRSTALILTAALVALFMILASRAGADSVSVQRFGEEGSGVNGLLEPGGIAVDQGGGRLFIADTENNRIDEYTSAGRFVRAWGWGVRTGAAKLQTCFGRTAEEEENGEGEGKECRRGLAGPQPGQLNATIGVAVSPDGNTVYAINSAKGDGRVQAFDISGNEVELLGALPIGFGKTGNGNANLTYPLPPTNDVAVGTDGRIYVAGEGNGGARIFVFSPQRELQKTIKAGLSSFSAITVDPEDGLIYLGERGGNIEVLNDEGKSLGEFNTGVFAGITAIAAVPGSENLLLEPNELDAETESVELTEVTQTGEVVRTFPVSPMTESRAFGRPNAWGLAIDPTAQYESESGPTVEPGEIYVVDRYGDAVNALAEPKPGKAIIESADFEAGTEGVNLTATVNPTGFDTHVYFEYGPTAAYGLTSPVPPGFDLGGGFAAETASVHLYGLQPGTTYHYAVVATNAAGTVTTNDRTFTTFSPGGFALPDGRAWEQVTTEKGAQNVGGNFAAPAGGGVALTSAQPLPGSPSGALNSGYVALRGAEGWHTEAATPPVNDSLGATFLVSPDLRQSVGLSDKDLTGNAPPGPNLYLRDNATGTETLMTPYARGTASRFYNSVGASADFSRIFFTSEAPLTPDTPGGEHTSLYEWSGGVVRNLGVLPGASAPTKASVEANVFIRPSHPISEDGSRVFFLTEPAPKEEGETNPLQLFVRIDGTRTVEVSASQAPIENPGAVAEFVAFVGASVDGSVAFFKSSTALTEGAAEGSEEERDLYRFDVNTGVLTDITVAEGASAQVAGVVVAADGRSAYFVARSVLAEGGTAGEPNLYRWTVGGGIEFVAALGEGDPISSTSQFESATNSSRLTADGSTLALTSEAPLDPRYPDAEGTKEIYLYTAATRSFVCASCTGTAGRQSVAEIGEPSSLSPGYTGNVLSADGSRVFFTTTAALASQDTNGKEDVYEWEGGSAYLISSGTGSVGSKLVDASASGDDVFFGTTERLVPGDVDGYGDVYDARVGGGLPGPLAAVPPCEGEACRSPTEAAPTNSIGSRSFNGPPDPKAKHQKKKHRKQKKHHRKRPRKQAKRQKQTRSHGHPAVGKRG